MRRVAHRGMGWGALLAALALGTLCCEGGRYQLILSYPDQAALDRARWVDVFVGEALSCEALRQSALAPRLSFDARGAMPSLGEVGFGRVAFRAEVRDEACQIFIDGCVEETLEAGQDTTIRIALQASSGAGCAATQRCEGGRCLVADGGASDAATVDVASADTASADRASLDSASEDSRSQDDAAPASDGAGGDDASVSADSSGGLDSASAGDSAGAPDASAVDTALPDASAVDTALPDARVCTPTAVSCRGDDLITCDGQGMSEDSRPCPLGCNALANPVRCNLLDPSNLSGSLLEGWDFDVLLDADTVVNTTDITLNGTPFDPSEYAIVAQGAGLPQLLVFGARTIVVAAGVRVRVVGSRAVALVATETVQLAGIIDVSATGTAEHLGDPWPWFYTELGGPGGYAGGGEGAAGAGPCPGQPGLGVDVANILSKGSGGGGHGGVGGEGGPSQDNNSGSGSWLGGGEGGGICGTPELVPLIGGSGGAGQSIVVGEGPGGDWPGPGGGGGGALQIAAGQSITIASGGGVLASGGGGGQTGNAGGAGGGAGGAILLEAPLVVIEPSAFVTAAGGGGASGDCS